jgi:hypothetical protein
MMKAKDFLLLGLVAGIVTGILEFGFGKVGSAFGFSIGLLLFGLILLAYEHIVK